MDHVEAQGEFAAAATKLFDAGILLPGVTSRRHGPSVTFPDRVLARGYRRHAAAGAPFCAYVVVANASRRRRLGASRASSQRRQVAYHGFARPGNVPSPAETTAPRRSTTYAGFGSALPRRDCGAAGRRA
ncbi:ATPase [Aureococcus anophagefferens]|nr:ATPase [Aureococcus anophagefferens]